jgi:hypothetical protein
MFFTREGNGWSPSNASGANRGPGSGRSTRRRLADSELEEEDGGRGKLCVPVGKDLKDGRSNLLWAARNILPVISSLSCCTSLPREHDW